MKIPSGLKLKTFKQAIKINKINKNLTMSERLDLANKYPASSLLEDKKKQRKTNRFNAALIRL